MTDSFHQKEADKTSLAQPLSIEVGVPNQEIVGSCVCQGVSNNVVASKPSCTGYELTTLVVIGIDCTSCCKSKYHNITTIPLKKVTIENILRYHFVILKLHIIYLNCENDEGLSVFPVISQLWREINHKEKNRKWNN